MIRSRVVVVIIWYYVMFGKIKLSFSLIENSLNINALEHLQLKPSKFVADKIGQAASGRYKKIDFVEFDWLSGEEDRNWWWQIQQLPCLKWFINAYEILKDEQKEKYLDFAISYIATWMENASKNKNSPLVWHDHVAILRLRNLSQWVTYLILINKVDRLTPDFQNKVVCAISEHINFLIKERNYSRHTNHGFDQSLDLYTVCWLWRDIDTLKKVSELALSRLLDEIDFAFTAQGVHKENSPGYQSYMLQRLAFVKRLDLLGEKVASSKTELLEQKAHRFLKIISLPDGKLPLIGDTTYKDKGISSNLDAKKTVYDYTVSGYLVVKGINDKGEDYHLVVKSGHLSNYHRHDDDLSFYLYMNGEVVFGDGGLYSYNEKDPIRRFIRSPLAHNTVFPASYTCTRNLNELSKRPSLTLLEGDEVVAKTHCYGGTLERRINFSRIGNCVLSIEDCWLSKPKQYQLLQANYFIPNDKCIIPLLSALVIQTEKNSIKIHSESANQRIKPVVHNDSPTHPVKYSDEFAVSHDATRVTFEASVKSGETIHHKILLSFESDYSRKLFVNNLHGLSEQQLIATFWEMTPVNTEKENRLDKVLDILGNAEVESLHTELLYILIRSYIWSKRIDMAIKLSNDLEKRPDASLSQLINGFHKIVVHLSVADKDYVPIMLKLLRLIHGSGYGRFRELYVKLSEKLYADLQVEPICYSDGSDVVPYPIICESLRKHFPECAINSKI